MTNGKDQGESGQQEQYGFSKHQRQVFLLAKIKVGERLMGVASLAVDRLAAQRSLPHLFVVQIRGCLREL